LNDRFQLLAALKGPALKCLIVFCWERRQLTISELVSYVGHDDQTVRKAMNQLQLYGLAAQVIGSQETWHLTDQGYQLPLPMESLCSIGEKDFLLSTTTTTLSVPSSDSEQSGSSSSSTRGENFSSPPADSPLDAEVSAALCALHRAGIMGRKAVALARLEWVTPRYVMAMHARWQQEGYTSRDTGLLVRYIEDGDPEPLICEECECINGHHHWCKSFGDLEKLAELVATGEVKSIKKPSPALVQAMMRYNQDRLEITY
jgi:hypothetical protein